MLKRRNTIVDVTLLVVLSALTYLPGLTTHGLTNWQESMRVQVAQSMQQSGEWLVPTASGEVYLAKPPLVYWCQLAIATATNSHIGVWQLRLTVSLAGIAGVVATYIVGRRLLAGQREGEEGEAIAQHGAFWGAAILATGVLFVRSARIGELDMLLVPPTIVGIGAIVAAMRSHFDRARTHWGAVALMLACAALCGLTKGPPGLVCLLAPYVGVALVGMFGERAEGSRAAWVVRTFARSHPAGLLIVGLGAYWLWLYGVSVRIGPEAVESAVRHEAGENLNALVPEAPLNNLVAMSYAVGLGGLIALAGTTWCVAKRRLPAMTLGYATIVCWIAVPFVIFSLFGKGVPRYLTPMWPALALLAGFWFARLLHAVSRPAPLRRMTASVVILLALGQSVWYGFGREVLFADRSPRSFATALAERVGDEPVYSVDLWSPALEFYLRRDVTPIEDVGPEMEQPGDYPARIESVIGLLEKPAVLLVRETAHPIRADRGNPVERLSSEYGLSVEPIAIDAAYTIDHDTTRVVAVRVRRD